METWPTAAARDGKGSSVIGARSRTSGALDEAAEQLFPRSLQDPAPVTSGGPSSPPAPTSPRLALIEWIASWWKAPLAALCEASLRGEIGVSAGELHEERLEALLTTLSTRRQLNPRFAEWLMGWEPGWTSLAPLAFASRETASYRNAPHSPSGPSGDNWPTPDTQNARGGQMRAEAKGKHAMSLHHVVAEFDELAAGGAG